MSESNIPSNSVQFSLRVSLIVLGLKLTTLNLFAPIHQQIKLAQKTVAYDPTDKLLMALVAILASARGLVETNKLVRADPALFERL